MAKSISKIRHIQESNLRLEKRFITESKTNIKEGFGTVLLILTGLGVYYVRKYIKALKEIAINLSNSTIEDVSKFLDIASDIEEGAEEGNILVEKDGNDYIIIVEKNGKEHAVLVFDTETDEAFIDKGKNKRVIPMTMKNNDKIEPGSIELQKGFVHLIKKIIDKHSKKIN